jgi:hypothetical protein
MISTIFWSGLAITVLLIGLFVEQGLFNHNLAAVVVLASRRH